MMTHASLAVLVLTLCPLAQGGPAEDKPARTGVKRFSSTFEF